ncbi:Holliday junction resolvase RecU [Fictibacillus iocasae]|uniref:Holliday junction resolvase RecU n=1 Tax=Fictibacillus iocasae TaxID=2715437 RepID=A0ABW2NMY4_9BACL
MFHYPNGRKTVQSAPQKSSPQTKTEYGKRGMTLEEDINQSNEFYLAKGLAVIHKKPTPVQIVSVHYPKRSAAVIQEAYFKTASTTDYNGVYKGRHIDFEAKETKNKSSFPLKNFHVHQISHMEAVQKQGGIAFVILRFSLIDETFLLDASYLFPYFKSGYKGRKSILLSEIASCGMALPLSLSPRIHYLKAVDALYFTSIGS